MSLKIRYSSIYELMEIFKRHPEEVADADRRCAIANRKVDDLTMELEILTAEIIDEIVKKRKVPASAKQEVRRAEVQLDKRWQNKRKELNEAVEDSLILQGRSKGMFVRGRLLEMLGKIELRTTLGNPTVRREEVNIEDLVSNLEYPEE